MPAWCRVSTKGRPVREICLYCDVTDTCVTQLWRSAGWGRATAHGWGRATAHADVIKDADEAYRRVVYRMRCAQCSSGYASRNNLFTHLRCNPWHAVWGVAVPPLPRPPVRVPLHSIPTEAPVHVLSSSRLPLTSCSLFFSALQASKLSLL